MRREAGPPAARALPEPTKRPVPVRVLASLVSKASRKKKGVGRNKGGTKDKEGKEREKYR